jgi:hypothetical protein
MPSEGKEAEYTQRMEMINHILDNVGIEVNVLDSPPG